MTECVLKKYVLVIYSVTNMVQLEAFYSSFYIPVMVQWLVLTNLVA